MTVQGPLVKLQCTVVITSVGYCAAVQKHNHLEENAVLINTTCMVWASLRSKDEIDIRALFVIELRVR
jgi:hypothetical protein